MLLFSFPLMARIDRVSQRQIMLVAAENTHSLYYLQDVYEAASEPYELVIVPDADHVDLYDNAEKILFDHRMNFSELT